ncbi:unnamed protein product [Closterium sp. NIES-53]
MSAPPLHPSPSTFPHPPRPRSSTSSPCSPPSALFHPSLSFPPHVTLSPPPSPLPSVLVTLRQFEDPRDAEDAIRGRDEYDFDRNRLRAELASSPPLPSFPFPPSHHPLPPSPFSLPPSVSLCPLALCNHVPPRYNPVPSSPHFTNPQFADPRDTKDAIRRRDEYDFDENCLRVELAHGSPGRLQCICRRKASQRRTLVEFQNSWCYRRPSDRPCMSSSMSGRSHRTVYVGNLPGDTRESEVEDLFAKYGKILDIELKLPPRPPGFAFVEFADPRDAEDAIRGRDGYDFDGNRLRVELAHGGRGAGGGFGGGRGGDFQRGPSRRTEYRVIVKNLPTSASWQDLKDHMRRAGDVCFAQVFKERDGMMGIVDYSNEEDMS